MISPLNAKVVPQVDKDAWDGAVGPKVSSSVGDRAGATKVEDSVADKVEDSVAAGTGRDGAVASLGAKVDAAFFYKPRDAPKA